MNDQEMKENKHDKTNEKKSKSSGFGPSLTPLSIFIWVLILLGALAAIRIFGSLATLLGLGAGWLVLNDLTKKGKSRKTVILLSLLTGIAAAFVCAVLFAFMGIAI